MADKDFMSKKKEIIQSIYPLFTEKGLKGTTVKEICKAANIALGTFYHYFPSKDAIVEDLFEMMDYEFEEKKPWIYAKENASDQLHCFVECFAHYVNQWGFFTNVLVMKTVLENSPADSSSRKVYALLKEIIQKGQSKGELRSDFSVEDMSGFLWIFIRGTLFEWTKHPENYSLIKIMKEGSSLMIESFTQNKEKK